MRTFLVRSFFVLLTLSSSNLYSQAIGLVRNLAFGDQILGVAATVIIAPTDPGAALFNAKSMIPGRHVVCSVPTTSIVITNGAIGIRNRITVNNFTISGCTSVVPANGRISNIGVGARATITANKKQGSYSGTATFRIVTY
jgi:hypothetical protein